MKLGYPIAIAFAMFAVLALLTENLGVLDHPTMVALVLLTASLVVTCWQGEHERRNRGR